MLNELTNNESLQKLKSIVDCYENLTDRKKEVQQEINDLLAEAKAFGFDVKALKQVIKIKNSDKTKLEQEEYMVELYKDKLNIN